MFEVGFTEIVLIVGLALLVLGPEKLPGLVNKVGRWTGRARSMARQLRMQLEHEVTIDELTKSRPMSSGPPPYPSSEPTYDAAVERTSSIDDSVGDPATPANAEPTVNGPQLTEAPPERTVDLSKPLQ